MNINNNTTILDFALAEVERICGNDEKCNSFLESVIFLFTSQGLEKVSYLEFEAEFPDKAHNLSKLIRFVASRKGQVMISRMLENDYYLENKIRNNKNYYSEDDDFGSSYNKAVMKF